LLVSLVHPAPSVYGRAWPNTASLHHILCRASASDDCFADFGGDILRLDYVPQGRAFAFMGDFLCHDDECFGFSNVADVDSHLLAAG
jgi:hypothetical protein